jgi:hypothetical protein
MKNKIFFQPFLFAFLCFNLITNLSSLALNKKQQQTANTTVPINVIVRSINDLKVKESQKIKIGQVLALRPLDPETPQSYISQKHDRDVQKQKEKLAEIKQIVAKNKLDPIIIQHEEAKLKDLEFEAAEFRKGAIIPKAPKETTYKSPVNGLIRKIRYINSSDGKLNIELSIETQS